MIYSDPTTKQGLVQDVDFLVDTDNNTYPIEQKTRNFNNAGNYASALIIGCDGTWQWNDTNYTTLPIGTDSLTNGQQTYRFASEHLFVLAVEIKDTNGNWLKLKPIDLYSSDTNTITDFMKTPGVPQYYDKSSDVITLYPAPNYTQAASLKVHYQTKLTQFLTTDTTKEPGFAPHLHRYLSICVAYDWAVAKQHPKMNWLANEKTRYEQEIVKFYSRRTKDEVRRIVPMYQNNR